MSITQETAVLDKLRSRGYWQVVIRPTTFQKDRIRGYADLLPIIDRSAIQFRGDAYPRVDPAQEILKGADWVEQEHDWQDQIDLWRFHQSGLFVHYLAMAEDWRDRSDWRTPEPGWAPLREVEYPAALYRITEILEFAARLALSAAGSSPMRVEISLRPLKDRRLVAPAPVYDFPSEHRTQARDWCFSWVGPQTELVARSRELAALAARELFLRFGLDLPVSVLAELQRKLAP